MRTAPVVCLVVMTASAAAQPAGVQAEALFRQGKEQMAAKKYAEACALFASSQKLEPSLVTLLNEANCREKNGQLATAWGLFVDAARQSRSQTDDAAKMMNTTATARAGKLEPRLSKLAINVAADRQMPGLEVVRDRDRVDPALWNHALPVDGGTYKVIARAQGYTEWSATVTIKVEGDNQSVDVPKLQPAAATTVKPKPDERDEPEEHVRTSGKRSRVVPIAIGAGGLVLGGIAFAVSRSGDSIYDRAKREPDDAKQESLWKQANNRRYIAEGLAVAGVGCIGAAVFLYVRSGNAEKPSVARRRFTVEPLATAGGTGLPLGGSW